MRDAIKGGVRIIVTTLQKFPVIFKEVDHVKGRNYAIIVDEAHSSQTGLSAMKLKTALADTEEALREYAEMEGKAEEELDPQDKLLHEISQIVRMFDEELHKEYIFLSKLLRLLPKDNVEMMDLEGKLKLKYYKLQKTFDGAIRLKESPGIYAPTKAKDAIQAEGKRPLDGNHRKNQCAVQGSVHRRRQSTPHGASFQTDER